MASQDERATGMDLQKLIRLITLALAVAAVVKELRKPPEERTWNGVLGFVPTTSASRRSRASRSACGTRRVRT